MVVSNRLPYQIDRSQDGDIQIKQGSGGLVRALLPLLQTKGGVWIGWDGQLQQSLERTDQDLSHLLPHESFQISGIGITEAEYRDFYMGFANEIIWPLFHISPTLCRFIPSFWDSYLELNQRFAKCVQKNLYENSFIWVHDYHLMQVGSYLRKMRIEQSMGFFLHIPFPPYDVFAMLPWRNNIISGLLDFDSIGFQTKRDLMNFTDCVKRIIPDINVQPVNEHVMIHHGNRIVHANAYPISIDAQAFKNIADDKNVIKASKKLRADISHRKMIFSAERLDYTKGIINKLEAFEFFLNQYPELHNEVTLVLHISPSREDIPDYSHIKQDIECLVSKINGKFTQSGWVPIHFIYHSLDEYELTAYYLAADIALITPIIDGMNLVSKEYCVSNRGDGVLILSEFAGSSFQLRDHALIVNPYDVISMANAIYQATKMPKQERCQRMAFLRKSILDNNVYQWANSFIMATDRVSLCAN